MFDRQQALEQTMLLFWAHGYEGVSIEGLVARLGLSPPSLYNAFGSKERLFRAAVEHYIDTRLVFMVELLSSQRSSRQAVEDLLMECAARYTAQDHPGGCMIASGLLLSAMQNAGAASFLRQKRQMAVDLLVRRFSMAIQNGDLPAGADAMALANYLGAVMQGMSVRATDGAGLPELQSIARQAIKAWPV